MIRNENKKEGSGERFKWFQVEILLVFTAIILIVTAFLSYVILERSGRSMKQTASKLIAADCRQLELNINSYLERMETVPTLLFSDESYYLYDATDESIEAYDKIKDEENIKNRIVDIGLMENYSDFGIIYSDDHKVGWISHGTQDLFPDGGIYDGFAGYITNEKKNDGWCFGINGNTDRIFYIKRLNPNAILISAIYTKELSSAFIYPEQLDEMTLRLVDSTDTIMFSTSSDEIGAKLPEEIEDELSLSREHIGLFVGADKSDYTDNDNSNVSSSVISDDYIINTNICSNDWRVICSLPTKSILGENTKLKRFTVRISVCLAVMFVLIGLLLILRLSRPVDGMVSLLKEKAEIDKLSGVMNKSAFQDGVEKYLLDNKDNRVMSFVMLDMDNFKQVNDRLGHAYGDEVIIRVGKLLRQLCGEETLIGRVGGDEFAFFTGYADVSKEEVGNSVKEQMEHVLEAFGSEFAKEKESCGVSISAGIYLTQNTEDGFKEMYENADKALYTSKKAGKSQYTFFD